jgi:four helix bundle protein
MLNAEFHPDQSPERIVTAIPSRRMKSHKDLVVWQKAVVLAGNVYRATNSFPSHELYGLTAQLRRAAVSIASNLAEGCARASRKELIQFLHVARGSLAELETQIEIARTLGLLPVNSTLFEDAGEVGRMINGLISSLRPPGSSVSALFRPSSLTPNP